MLTLHFRFIFSLWKLHSPSELLSTSTFHINGRATLAVSTWNGIVLFLIFWWVTNYAAAYVIVFPLISVEQIFETNPLSNGDLGTKKSTSFWWNGRCDHAGFKKKIGPQCVHVWQTKLSYLFYCLVSHWVSIRRANIWLPLGSFQYWSCSSITQDN